MTRTKDHVKTHDATVSAGAVLKVPRSETEDGMSSHRHSQREFMGPTWAAFALIPVFALGLLILGGVYFEAVGFLLVELLLALTSLAVGTFFGFLFGSPRSDLGVESKTRPLTIRYIPANLDPIADWLTKIIVGVGLIEMGQVATQLERMGRFVQASIEPTPPFTAVLSQIVVILFGAVGFLGSFLWARLYYGPLQTVVDSNVLNDLQVRVDKIDTKVTEQASKTEEVETVTKLIARGDIASSGDVDLSVVRDSKSITSDRIVDRWPPDVREKFEEFLKAPANWNSDPARRLFKSASSEFNGYKITGAIDLELSGALIIRIDITCSDKDSLGGMVTFLLHPTLSPRVKYAGLADGAASTKFYAEGWFTVVAILNEGSVILALDLKTIKGVPAWFKEN